MEGPARLSPLSAFGLFAVALMVVFYAVADRSRWNVLGFALACGLGSIYSFLQGAWPFGVVEAIWGGYRGLALKEKGVGAADLLGSPKKDDIVFAVPWSHSSGGSMGYWEEKWLNDQYNKRNPGQENHPDSLRKSEKVSPPKPAAPEKERTPEKKK